MKIECNEWRINLKRIIRLPKKTILTVLILCGLIASIPFTVKAYNNHNYNDYLALGQDCLGEERYEEAVYNFDNALKYSKSEADYIKELIDQAVMLNLSMHNFQEGAKLCYEKKYELAIAAFEKVSIQDNQRYDVSREKIKECRAAFITANITAAKEEALKLNYDKAIIYIDSALKVEPQNQEAISLKNDYTSKLVFSAAK